MINFLFVESTVINDNVNNRQLKQIYDVSTLNKLRYPVKIRKTSTT